MLRRNTLLAMFSVALCAGAVALAADATKSDAPAAAPTKTAPFTSDEGFVAVFNGKDLKGWDGNPDLWSVKDGCIRGETTAEKPAKGNTFIIWRGQPSPDGGLRPASGTLKDFALKLKFRIQNGNSGVQYRSFDMGNWVVGGYQAEVCNFPGQPGFLYHERGRASLANLGESVVIGPDGKKEVVSKFSDRKALTDAGFYKEKDWNEYTIVARGNHIEQYLNGYKTIDLVDNDKPATKADIKGKALEGILALQIHAGPPMVVEFKDIRVKDLSGEAAKDSKPAAEK